MNSFGNPWDKEKNYVAWHWREAELWANSYKPMFGKKNESTPPPSYIFHDSSSPTSGGFVKAVIKLLACVALIFIALACLGWYTSNKKILAKNVTLVRPAHVAVIPAPKIESDNDFQYVIKCLNLLDTKKVLANDGGTKFLRECNKAKGKGF